MGGGGGAAAEAMASAVLAEAAPASPGIGSPIRRTWLTSCKCTTKGGEAIYSHISSCMHTNIYR